MVVIDISSPQDHDPAPLRSLKEITKKHYQPSSSVNKHVTMVSSRTSDASSLAVNHYEPPSSVTLKRMAPDAADNYGQGSSQYKRSRNSQKVADELENSVEHRMRPSQIQAKWEHVFRLVQNATASFFTQSNADAIQYVKLVQPQARSEQLAKLYNQILGVDNWRISFMQHAGLLKAYHVLMALVGCIIYEVALCEARDPWLVHSQDEKMPYLVKVLEAQGELARVSLESTTARLLNNHAEINSRDIFKRAEYEWLESASYMEQHVTPRAAQLAFEYSQVLRPHLECLFDRTKTNLTFERCLRDFGSNLQSVLEASMLLQAKLTLLEPLNLSWPDSGSMFDNTWMSQLNESPATTKLAVTMALLPALVTVEHSKVIGKAVVCCHFSRDEATPEI